MTVQIHTGDCRDVLAVLPEKSVQCCVTSPPYFGLRSYGIGIENGEIGLEKSPDAYVTEIVAVFREVRRVLRDSGTVLLNLGDSYAGSWGNYGGQNRGAGKHRQMVSGSRVPNEAWDDRTAFLPPAARGFPGIKPKDLIGTPWMVAFALRADGWYLRADIVWRKRAPMPESVKDRPTRSHEHVFLLSKNEKYFYNTVDARDPLKATSIARLTQPNYDDQEGSDRANGGEKTNGKMKAVAAHFGGRNKSQINDQTRLASGNEWQQDPATGANWRDVWDIAHEGTKEAHFATMPQELARRCIVAGTPIGGTVLDPFFGAGTTGLVADRLQRNCIGIELNPAYAAMARTRCDRDAPLLAVPA